MCNFFMWCVSVCVLGGCGRGRGGCKKGETYGKEGGRRGGSVSDEKEGSWYQKMTKDERTERTTAGQLPHTHTHTHTSVSSHILSFSAVISVCQFLSPLVLASTLLFLSLFYIPAKTSEFPKTPNMSG